MSFFLPTLITVAVGVLLYAALRVRRALEEYKTLSKRLNRTLEALECAEATAWSWEPGTDGLTLNPPDSAFAKFAADILTEGPNEARPVVHPADIDRTLAEIRQAAGEDRRFRVAVRVADRTNGDRAVEIAGRAFRNPNGEISSVAGIAREHTAGARAEAMLSRQSQLLAQVHDAIISTDLDGKIETWNAGAERLYGYGVADAEGRHIGLLNFPEEQDDMEQQMTAAVLASGAHEFVGRFRHRSGYQLYAAVRLALLRDEDGAPVGVVSCSHDVTKQREEEEAFQLRARVLESMNEGVCLTDRHGVVLHTNPACDEMYGQPQRGLLGRKLETLLVGSAEQSLEKIEQIRKILDREGRWSGELTSRRWDGALFTAQARVSALELSEGVFWVWVQQDVTRRKRSEAALKEREERFRMMADSAPVMVWMTDDRGQCTYVNAAWVKLTGLSFEESLGAGWTAAQHPDDRRDWGGEFSKRFERREQFETELRLRSAAGDFRWILFRGVPRYEGSGAFAGYIGSAIDITERKLAEEERRELLRRSEQQQKLESLGVMAGGIAHDFNNLLVSMLGYAELALESVEAHTPSREHVEQFQIAAQRAAELTNQILAFSGKRRLRLEQLSLSQAVIETLALIESSMSPRVLVDVELDKGDGAIEADPGQLRQVIMNLLLNASDAVREQGGCITVRTGATRATEERLAAAVGGDGCTPGGFVFLEIVDDGSGIDEDTMGRIFDPFFTTKFTGRGLGLAATLGVVRGHGGAIEVESRAGQGSLFRVLFPAAGTVSATTTGGAPPARGSETLLLIDDDAGVLDSTRQMLELLGYRVFTASDGAAGVKTFAEDPGGIDVVLIDIVMPGLTAAQTIERIRAVRPEARVLLWSGYNEAESTAEFFGHTISGFLQKPFTPTQLTTKIREAVSEPETLGAPRTARRAAG